MGRLSRALVAGLALMASTAPGPADADDGLDGPALQALAEEALVYGFPMVMGYGVMYQYAVDRSAEQFKAPFNQLYNTARVYTPEDTAVVTPNSDTPYSFVWADLRAEPIVVHVPAVQAGRYVSVQLVDLYTFNFGYVGSRTTGNGPGTYLIAGPHWSGEAPAGIERVFRCETEFAFAILRTQLFGPDDLSSVKEIQSGYRVQTLSAFRGEAPPAPAPEIQWLPFEKQRAATDPFSYVAFLLQFCPATGPADVESPLRARLAKLGIEAGKPASLERLTSEQRQVVAAGMRSGMARIKARVQAIGREAGGWRLGSAAGDRAFFAGDWALRAAGAMAGIYGNTMAEAFYPFLASDSEGNKVDTSVRRYTMTFPAHRLPPVRAFWSITMYDARSQFLVANPIQRYLINSTMLESLKRNGDGSLTVHIQRDSPGAARESNWLPAPNGPVFLVMRLYWPEASALDGSWTPPPVVPVLEGERPGSKSHEVVVRTDERYGSDGLFQGPRGWSYFKGLAHARAIQNPNLWPDTQSTYFLAQFALPPGSRLTSKFAFPHARYFQLALYRAEGGTFVSTGDALSGAAIEPDAGCTNPFRVGADRRAERRDFTLHVVAEDPPAAQGDRAINTLYVGKDPGVLQSVVRIYLPDRGWDGAGWALGSGPTAQQAFRYEGRLADGTTLDEAEVVRRFARPIPGATAAPFTADQWVSLVSAKGNDSSVSPATAPARQEPRWEKYGGIRYSILGAFLNADERAKIPFGGAMDGGGDPTTQYFLTHLSRKFGPVYVMRGRMPTFPDTFEGHDGRGGAVTPPAQVQYWSLVSCEAAPSGQIVDGLTDMQVPIDAERNYVIVYSRREDRPKNATPDNGVAWIEWSPRGEGIDHPKNREDFGMLMLRIMATSPDWKERPEGVTQPGTEESVMGPYLPRGTYTDRASFEALGSRVK